MLYDGVGMIIPCAAFVYPGRKAGAGLFPLPAELSGRTSAHWRIFCCGGIVMQSDHLKFSFTKWYSATSEATIDLKETLYNTFLFRAKTRPDRIALFISESGERYTYGEIIKLIDAAAGGFSQLGVSIGSKVGILLNGTVEETVSLLALNKIGAISKFIDYMKSPTAIKHSIEETDLSFLVIDVSFLSLVPLINASNIPIIIVNARGETPIDGIYFEQLYEHGTSVVTNAVPYSDGRPSVMINSSGTTGEPKPIVHTDYSINAAAQKMLVTDYPLGPGNALVKMIPSQIGLGLITSLYTGLLSGAVVVSVGVKEPPVLINEVAQLTQDFSKLKPLLGLQKDSSLNIFSTPLFLTGIISSELVTDLSCIGSLLAAGSKMTRGELERLENIAKAKGCMVPICNGYGQNEMAGAVTLNHNAHNINGSAGFPTMGSRIIIVDPETLVERGINEIGLILEQCNSHFKEYENMPKRSDDAWLTLSDGSRWYNSCDLGYINEDGFLFITGRTTRVVVRTDFKLSLDDIEAKIKTLPLVYDCATIVPKIGGSIEEIVAFIQSDYTDIDSFAKALRASNILSEFEMPTKFIMTGNIPYTQNGKIDYRALERQVAQEQ